MMAYVIVAIVALIVGYHFGPRVVGVARHEYDAAIAELAKLKADVEKLKG